MCFEWLVKWDWENFIPAASPGDSPLAQRWYEPFSVFSTFTLPRSRFPSTPLMEVGAGAWGDGREGCGSSGAAGMEGWRRKERSPGRQAGGGGSGYRAYLFSGMRQVRYPHLRLAHLFMLNATRRESAAVSQEVQKAIFLTVCCLLQIADLLGSVFFFFLPPPPPARPWDPCVG